MWTELILLTSTLLGAYAETINASAGMDVLLPCHCPWKPKPPDGPYVVWQIGDIRIVDYYTSELNKTGIDPLFLGRTQLFLPNDMGNCSLLLKNVTTVDNETYTCHYKNPRHTQADVTLTVSEAPPKLPTQSPLSRLREHEVPCAIGGVFFVLSILLTVFLTFTYRKKCRRTTVNTPGPQDSEQNHPLHPLSV
ncbi:hypothetical protein GJAV_G00210530 [Gymnothorax javanicus]|nr:hypothetical protein GJAV_G00210530 [Gymnothorax javanicus]